VLFDVRQQNTTTMIPSKELLDALAIIDKERQKHIIHVEVLDRDSQPLSIGEAILDTPETDGVFEPRPATTEGIPTEAATNLKTIDGKIFQLERFQKCSASPFHYHFRTKRE